jgi:hypothetical protein
MDLRFIKLYEPMRMTHARVLLIDPACIEKGRGVLIPHPRVLSIDREVTP